MKKSPSDGQLLLHSPAPGPNRFFPPFPQSQMCEEFLDPGLACIDGHVPDSPIEFEVVFCTQPFVES